VEFAAPPPHGQQHLLAQYGFSDFVEQQQVDNNDPGFGLLDDFLL
jgi:hypothetical protein